MFSKIVVTGLTLFSFMLTYAVPRGFVYVVAHSRVPAYSSLQQTQERQTRRATPASSLARILKAAERRLAHLKTQAGAGPASPDYIQSIRSLRTRIQAEKASVIAQLAAVGERIQAESLPEVIRSRHQNKLEEVNRGLNSLQIALEKVEAALPSEQPTRLTEALEILSLAVGPSLTNPLDPNRLPYRPATPQTQAPRTKASEFAPPKSAQRDSPAVKASQPNPQDLAETVDVQFSSGIRDLADSLGNDPLAIYNWTRQNVVFVPTFGSIQGSEGCRLTLECNAYDAASFLIALLRFSGVPTRYVIGTVEVEPVLFRSALGDFEDLEAAARLAASGGIPTTIVTDGGGSPVAVRFEHVWVEAFVDYVPSRGAVRGTSDTWVPLDPVLKPMRFQAPVDIAGALNADSQSILDDILATGTLGNDGQSIAGLSMSEIESIRSDLTDGFRTFLDQNLSQTATVGDVIGAVNIDTQPLSVFPGATPGKVLTVGSRVSELPAPSRHTITLQVLDRLGITEEIRLERSTPELANKRVTIQYIPATEADQATLDAFGGILETPPHLVEVQPVIYEDGVPLGVGSPSNPGREQIIRVSFNEPTGASESVEHRILAGTYAALGIDLQRIAPELLETRGAKLNAANDLVGVEDVNADDILGEILNIHAQTYFAQVEAYSRIVSHQYNVVAIKRPAEMLATMAPSFSFLFGTAVDVTNFGMNVDVRRFVVSVSSRTGDRDRERAFVYVTGSFSSAAEHSIFETLQQNQSVSAVKLISLAQERQIPVFAVDSTNVDAVVPQLTVSEAVINDLQNSVAAGKSVLIPRDNVPLLDFEGVGYIVLNSETGAAAYLISGGLSGGGTAEDSDLLQVIKNVLSKLNTLRGIGELISELKPLRFAAKLPVIGLLLSVVDAVFTGIEIGQRTDDLWSGVGAGSASFLLNLAVSGLMTLAGIGALAALGLGGLITAITISLIVGVVVSAIQTAVLDAVFPPNEPRRLKKRASNRPKPKNNSDLGADPG